MRRFRLSDNAAWATEFEATEATFESELVAALQRSAGRLVSLHVLGSEAMSDSASWWNVGQVEMGVHYDGQHPDGHHPGCWEIRGNGLRFLCISPEHPCADVVWAEAHHQRPRPLPEIDCRPGQTEPQLTLQSLFTDLVAAGRNQRRQCVYRSPGLPADRAQAEESTRNDHMNDLGRQYREAAEAYLHDTDWSEWQRYVLRAVRPREIACLVIEAVLGQVTETLTPGRPRLHTEPMRRLEVQLPEALHADLSAKAAEMGISLSELIRRRLSE
jgi:hypothetical protein